MNEAEHLVETQRWLRYARENLAGAETLLEQRVVVPRHICWLAQQSAEKAIKAILVFLAIDFPRRHDLDALRNLVPNDWQVKTEYADLAALTEWEVTHFFDPTTNLWAAIDINGYLVAAWKLYPSQVQELRHSGNVT